MLSKETIQLPPLPQKILVLPAQTWAPMALFQLLILLQEPKESARLSLSNVLTSKSNSRLPRRLLGGVLMAPLVMAPLGLILMAPPALPMLVPLTAALLLLLKELSWLRKPV